MPEVKINVQSPAKCVLLIGKFRSAAVVGALLTLLQDTDNNVRAVAAISLARSGQSTVHAHP